MSGTTEHGWPYVTPEDHPLEFPTHSQALANKLDARFAGLPHAVATGTVTTAGAGVSFPAGRFTATPVVVATPEWNNAATATISGVSRLGFTVRCFDQTGAALTTTIHWIAIQHDAA